MNKQTYTQEQSLIIEHHDNARINAVAGAGKTTTLIGYAAARASKRILYLAYNRSVKIEAEQKFRKAGCQNVRVETAHSLAYKELGVKGKYTLNKNGNLKATDIVELCGLNPPKPGSMMHLVVAKHVLSFLNLYTNSSVRKLDDVDYLSTLPAGASRTIANQYLSEIVSCARLVLTNMYNGKTPITHDAYLKFYQLSNPQLNYDCILFDEGQDASAAMTSVFENQKATKLIVGDSHQQIYGFRHAVNSLEQMDYPNFLLTTSFRFDQKIADKAMQVLKTKALIGRDGEQVIVGAGGAGDGGGQIRQAIIARSNLSLLARAIAEVEEGRAKKLAFEGDINSYTYLSEGASLYDVLYLSLGKRDKIRDGLIRSFGTIDDLNEYVEDADDREMGLVAEVVEKYGADLFTYIKELKERQTEKSKADVVFSTVHRAKGLEYENVKLTEDFMTSERILRMLARDPKLLEDPLQVRYLTEEINILYVAVTRAMKQVHIPFPL